MDLSDRRRGMRVASEFLAKQSVELTGCVHTMAEQLGSPSTARWDTEAVNARCCIAAIRRELADLESFIAGKEPRIEPAPRAA